MKPCETPQYIDVHTILRPKELRKKLESVFSCNDTPFRKNLTIIYTAGVVRALPEGNPGLGVETSSKWITNSEYYSNITAESFINVLKSQYFLVGVTERLNEYLVLVALANQWEFSSLYYRRCKPSNLDVKKPEFERYFPELAKKLEAASEPALHAYEWARDQFDNHVSQLGSWFQDQVTEFEVGLKEFQNTRHAEPGSYLWKTFHYVDGHPDTC
jgi:hypothetical protein